MQAAGQRDVIVTSGGTGTFNADLDGDGDIDGSHFGFAVIKFRFVPRTNGHLSVR